MQKPPPVPPQNRSPKGGGEPAQSRPATPDAAPNPDKQGHQGNTKLNTTHQGYQQDR